MALALGMTVGRLLEEIDSAEITEWMAFSQLEPFGAEMDNWRTALIASQIQNWSGNSKKKSSPKDYMPKVSRKQTDKEQWEIMQKIAQSMGAVRRGG